MGCATLSYARDELQGKIIAGLHSIGALHNLGLVNKFEISELRAAIAELMVSRRRRYDMPDRSRGSGRGRSASRAAANAKRRFGVSRIRFGTRRSERPRSFHGDGESNISEN